MLLSNRIMESRVMATQTLVGAYLSLVSVEGAWLRPRGCVSNLSAKVVPNSFTGIEIRRTYWPIQSLDPLFIEEH